MNLHDNIPSLAMVSNEDGTITLEQYVCGNAERVAVHPVHVRHLAERLGMLRALSAADAELLWTERGHVTALRQENDRLKRNMLRLREYALVLQRDFSEHADWKHADLVEPMNQINGVVSLFDMACDDFADDYDAHMPVEHASVAREHATTSPKTGGFEAPPKTGVLSAADEPGERSSGGAPSALPGAPFAPGGALSAGGAPFAPPEDLRPRKSGGSKSLQLKLEGGHV